MELAKLIERKAELEKELEEVNKQISEKEMTFDEWYENAEKDDFDDLYELQCASKPVYDYIKERTDGNRYQIYDITWYVDDMEEEMQKEFQKCNFGSVKWDW